MFEEARYFGPNILTARNSSIHDRSNILDLENLTCTLPTTEAPPVLVSSTTTVTTVVTDPTTESVTEPVTIPVTGPQKFDALSIRFGTELKGNTDEAKKEIEDRILNESGLEILTIEVEIKKRPPIGRERAVFATHDVFIAYVFVITDTSESSSEVSPIDNMGHMLLQPFESIFVDFTDVEVLPKPPIPTSTPVPTKPPIETLPTTSTPTSSSTTTSTLADTTTTVPETANEGDTVLAKIEIQMGIRLRTVISSARMEIAMRVITGTTQEIKDIQVDITEVTRKSTNTHVAKISYSYILESGATRPNSAEFSELMSAPLQAAVVDLDSIKVAHVDDNVPLTTSTTTTSTTTTTTTDAIYITHRVDIRMGAIINDGKMVDSELANHLETNIDVDITEIAILKFPKALMSPTDLQNLNQMHFPTHFKDNLETIIFSATIGDEESSIDGEHGSWHEEYHIIIAMVYRDDINNEVLDGNDLMTLFTDYEFQAFTPVRNDIDIFINGVHDVNLTPTVTSTTTSTTSTSTTSITTITTTTSITTTTTPTTTTSTTTSTTTTSTSTSTTTTTSTTTSTSTTSTTSTRTSTTSTSETTTTSTTDKPTTEPSGRRKPHILFILSDDHGYHDVAYHGADVYTPNLDQLAGDGIKLENYYITQGCTPTRAQLMTGRYQIRYGMQKGVILPSQPRGLPLNEKLLPEAMKQCGYDTEMFGKWHLGMFKEAYHPQHRGFDHFLGFLTGGQDFYTHEKCNNFKGKKACGYDFREAYANQTEVIRWDLAEKYSNDIFYDGIKDRLANADPEKPLFTYLSYQAVHTPIQAPQKWIDMYANVQNTMRRNYNACLSAMDESIGDIINLFKEYGFWENTIVIFSSDNGGKNRSGGYNYPLRGDLNRNLSRIIKQGSLFEGGIKSIGFVNSPLIPKSKIGEINTNLIHVTDWLPTLLDLGQCPGLDYGGGPLDGVSHADWLMNSDSKTNDKNPDYIYRKEILHYINPLDQTDEIDERGDFKGPGEILENRCFSIQVRSALRYGKWKIFTGLNHKNDRWNPAPTRLLNPSLPSILTDREDQLALQAYQMKINETFVRPEECWNECADGETDIYARKGSLPECFYETNRPPTHIRLGLDEFPTSKAGSKAEQSERDTGFEPGDKLVFLYNLKDDPREIREISDEHPEVVQKLLLKLADYYDEQVKPHYPWPDQLANPELYNNTWIAWRD